MDWVSGPDRLVSAQDWEVPSPPPAEPRRSLPGGVGEVNAICRNSPNWVTTNRAGRKGVSVEPGGGLFGPSL